ncbi:chorismate-binding protein [Sphaerospermopsis sp. LEGE 08334]|nr:chorismate-binding protein [Sphaerospermopsis sp. LEGE 08334]
MNCQLIFYTVQVVAGLVPDSEPEKEYEETLHKSQNWS